MDTTAKEQVLKEIAALDQQVNLFGAELMVIERVEPVDAARYNAIKAELDTANGKLDAKRAELASIEDAGHAAQEELAAVLDSIDIGGETVSLRAIVPDEVAYQLLYVWLQQREVDKAELFATIKASYKSQIAELEDGISELATIRQENYKLVDRCADLESKRDAAADQIDEQQEEIARLKADNERLLKLLETSAKPKDTEDGKAALERWKANRPAIYDVEPIDNLKKRFTAKLAETDEAIEFGYLERGKYREVTAADAATFRNDLAGVKAEQADEQAGEDAVPHPVLDGGDLEPPALQFHASVYGDVQTASTVGTVVLSQEELTTRLLSLEKRVSEIIGDQMEAVAVA